jgi:hypothetical protein
MSSNSAVATALRRRSPLRFFLLVALLSVPFAWLGASGRELFPAIPISASYEAERIISVLLVGLAVIATVSRMRVPFPRRMASSRPGPAR